MHPTDLGHDSIVSAGNCGSTQHKELKQVLQIGFVGTGNNGIDSLVVLVEATADHRAWALSVLSKQDLGASKTYKTCPDMPDFMESIVRTYTSCRSCTLTGSSGTRAAQHQHSRQSRWEQQTSQGEHGQQGLANLRAICGDKE